MLSTLQTHISQALEPAASQHSSSPAHGDGYEYSSLPSGSSIRLLEVHPSQPDKISCSIITADLDQQPFYDCLSYTWGDPRVPLFQSIAPNYYKQKRTISLNGCLAQVTMNLYHALEMLRETKISQQASGSDMFSRLIWIDALCIDQNNIDERNSQVAMMDRIYSNAQLVVAWLGKGNRYTPRATRVVSQLANYRPVEPSLRQIGSSIVKTIYRTMVEPDTQGSQPQQKTMLKQKFPFMDSEDWYTLFALFQLSYFTRMWIFQEMMLARELVYVWGDSLFSKASLEKCSEIIVKNYPLASNNFMIKHSTFSSLHDHMHRPILVKPASSVMLTTKLTGNKERFERGNMPWDVLMPLHLGRTYSATNPRDNIYALLPWYKISTNPAHVNLSDLPTIDYSKSIEQTLTEFAAWQIRVSKTLFPLWLIEDRSKRSPALRDTLPSWVPDMSVPMTPAPLLMIRLQINWEAEGPNAAEEAAIPLDSGSLLLQAGYFDIIDCTAETLSDKPSFDALMSLLNFIRPTLGRHHPLKHVSYVEALWRTMIMDFGPKSPDSNGCPANPRLRQGFNEWLLSRPIFFPGPPASGDEYQSSLYYTVNRILLKEMVFQVSEDPAMFSEDAITLEHDQLWHEWKEFQTQKFTLRGPDKQSRSRWREKCDTFLRTLTELSTADPSGTFFNSHELNEHLTRGNQTGGFRLSKLGERKRIEEFQQLVNQVIGSRRLFLSKHGFLGLAGQSVQPGDQIWLVKGLGAPGIFRPQQDGKYEFFGQAFVYGIMHGEALRSGRIIFHDVELV